MKKIMILSGLVISLACRAQTNGVVVNARIKGLPAGRWVYYISEKGGPGVNDSVKTVQGGFHFKIKLKKGEGNAYQISIGKNYKTYTPHAYLELYLDKGYVNIWGDGPLFRNIKLSGSSFVGDYNAYRRFINADPQIGSLAVLRRELNEAYAKRDTAMLKKTALKMKTIHERKDRLSVQWIKHHPASPISAYILKDLRQSISFDKVERLFRTLRASAKNNIPAKTIAQSITKNKLTAIGSLAPDFTQPDMSGRPVSLKDFRGRYVLVDFWASWCAPCRAENPHVAEAYHRYKDHNFTVLGVSLDRPGGREKWLGAIRHDHLTWTQVSDLKFWDNAACRLYGIQSIPANFLVDPDGIIIAKNLYGAELDRKLAEVLK